MINLEIKDLSEHMQISFFESGEPRYGFSMNGSQLLDAIALYRNTIEEMTDANGKKMEEDNG